MIVALIISVLDILVAVPILIPGPPINPSLTTLIGTVTYAPMSVVRDANRGSPGRYTALVLDQTSRNLSQRWQS